jgi:hypothetical protein
MQHCQHPYTQIKFLKLDMGRPAKRNLMSLVLMSLYAMHADQYYGARQ